MLKIGLQFASRFWALSYDLALGFM